MERCWHCRVFCDDGRIEHYFFEAREHVLVSAHWTWGRVPGCVRECHPDRVEVRNQQGRTVLLATEVSREVLRGPTHF